MLIYMQFVLINHGIANRGQNITIRGTSRNVSFIRVWRNKQNFGTFIKTVLEMYFKVVNKTPKQDEYRYI